jgi:ABC-2 type transport system permease protein
MTSKMPEKLLGDLTNSNPASRFLSQSFAIVDVEMRKLRRDPMELFTRLAQPVLWLVVFGGVFSRVRGIPTGDVGYLDFMAPGILAQSILFSAIFYGIAVIWERDMGVIHKLLVSPAYREALVFGKALSAGIRGITQAALIYLLVVIMGIHVRWSFFPILGVLAAVFIGAAVFATFSLFVACLVRTRERFMGIGQLMTMPLFFASNAIYPLALMPAWLRIVSRLNPLTYLVDALRSLMISSSLGGHALSLDFCVLGIVFAGLLLITSRLYPTIIR